MYGIFFISCRDFNFNHMSGVEKLLDLFEQKPYLLSMGAGEIARIHNVSTLDVRAAKAERREKLLALGQSATLIKTRNKKLVSNILVIGDTHLPYEHKGYLEFCIEQYNKFNCNTVVHIGDLIDSHATSMHDSLPEAYSPGDELNQVIDLLKPWYKAFPNMQVVSGNHDQRVHRIASKNKIPPKWIKGFAEVLEVPNWVFAEEFIIGDILFTHGTGTSGNTAAIRRAIYQGMNVVMGHLHSEASVQYHQLHGKTIWGMQTGSGVDENSYGMNYAKNFPKKSIISCGVILGNQPLIIIKP